MSFDHKGRVSTEWAAWAFSRRTPQPADTLCESRIARLAKSAVRGFAQSRAVAPFVRALALVDWDNVLLICVVFAAFMGGLTAAGFIFLEKGCQ
jgi:hypothetical protein